MSTIPPLSPSASPIPGIARYRWRLLLAAVMVNVVITALTGWWLAQSRTSYQHHAEEHAQNTARLLEQNLADTLERVEFYLRLADVEAERLRSGQISDATFTDFLQRLQDLSVEMNALRIATAEGVITHQSDKMPPAGVRIDDRDYFRHLRDHPDNGTYVARPTVSRTTGEKVLILARRIGLPDGGFGGVVLATINLSQLDWLLSLLDVGRHGVVSLRNDSLGIISRYPLAAGTPERTQSELPELREFTAAGKQYGLIAARSPIDGMTRILAVRKIGKFPLYAVVGLAQQDYLAAWRQKAWFALAGIGLLLMVSAGTAWLLDRSWRERWQAIEQLRRKQARFEALANMSADWFWQQDEQFRFVELFVGSGHSQRKTRGDWLGKTRWEVGTDRTDEEWRVHREMLEVHQPFYDFEYCFIDEKGQRRCISSSGEPLFDETGRFTGYHGVAKDITDRKLYEERIEQMAQHDGLTGLPNRALFDDRLNHAISVAKREKREFALLYFDLDRFKPVNDTYGHAAGDRLLQMIAMRIRYLLRESDTVARIGGDEFAVLLPVIASHDDAVEVAQRIVIALTSPYTLDGIEGSIEIGVSIGIALYPVDGMAGEELISAADVAMFSAKREGNTYAFAGEVTEGYAPPASPAAEE